MYPTNTIKKPGPVNGTSFGNHVLEDVTKLRSYWITVGSKSNGWYHYKTIFGHTKKHQGYVHTEKRLCEDRVRRELSVGWEDRPQEKPSLLTPWFWTSSFQNCEKLNSCYISHPVCGILLWKS